MSLRTNEFGQLDWSPSNTKLGVDETGRFDWSIDHEMQTKSDWCWAACLSNALTCFGRYVGQAEIVDRFFRDHGSSPELLDDERIPSPEFVIDLWRSYGFDKPTWQDKPMPFEALVKEIATNGPVQIELWSDGDDKNRHLALIYGVRETTTGPKLSVSDPASMAPASYTYDEMLGPDPLPSGFGKWQRTYLNRGFQRGYLRRFFSRLTKYLANLTGFKEFKPNNDAAPTVQTVESKLSFAVPPNPLPLCQELALASYGYRCYRFRISSGETRKSRRADLERRLFLLESIPIWQPQGSIQYDKSLKDQLHPGLWYHQIYNTQGPRFYAHTQFFTELQQRLDSGWRTVWIGESWMTKRVDEAIQKLDADFSDREEEVRMMWLSRLGLVTLYLTKSDLHLIVSARTESQSIFPLLSRFPDAQLRKALQGLSA
jgi:hypothetical protein